MTDTDMQNPTSEFAIVSVRMTRDEAAKLGVLAREHSRTKSAEAAYAIRLYFQSEATSANAPARRRRAAK